MKIILIIYKELLENFTFKIFDEHMDLWRVSICFKDNYANSISLIIVL